jgi:hypothetical protein
MTRHTKLFRSKLSAELAPDTEVEKLLLGEYGSVFVAGPAVVAPRKIVFADQADVLSFQESVEIMSAQIGGFQMELQTAAM